MRITTSRTIGLVLGAGALIAACGNEAAPSGGRGATGGSSPQAGNGGSLAQGGSTSTGGTTSTGGSTSSCAAGTTDCGAGCVNTLTDSNNCGACGVVCGSDKSCVDGSCKCAPGFLECGGTCVESNAQNCGSCGNACAPGLVCSGGSCTTGCAPGLDACDGSCFDLTGHRLHCGSCTTVCPEGQDCWQSQCRCAQGKESCNGGPCQDVLSDEANCGGCGKTCPQGATCNQGTCECPEGQTACTASNACKDLMSDEQNCGECGKVCSGSTQCLFGGCVDPNSVNCGGGSQTNNKCNANDFNLLGKYWVNNNLWGQGSGSGSQCIWTTCQNGDLVGWGTSWNWSGQPNSVKSFSSLVFGWQWGWRVQNTGLPVQISSSTSVNCGWSFTVNLGGGTDTMNVAYDMWVHSNPNPGTNDTPTDEIMVWLYRNNGAGPIGQKTNGSPINIGGHTFDLYEGQGGAEWYVYSFVRTTNATTAVLDMMAFPRYLAQQGKMSSSKYLASVQAGTEVFIGEASLETHGFYCRVQ